MTDDVKAAVEALRRAARNSNAPELWHDEHLILAHLDGEPARQAAAVAAAREEQRLECSDSVLGYTCGCRYAVAHTPLTATPLADRIAAMEELLDTHRNYARGEQARAEKAEAERDALREEARAHAAKCIATDLIAVENERDTLRAQVEGQVKDIHCLMNKAMDISDESKVLRAQVEAARAEYSKPHSECCNSDECADECEAATVDSIILAMDGAKP